MLARVSVIVNQHGCIETNEAMLIYTTGGDIPPPQTNMEAAILNQVHC